MARSLKGVTVIAVASSACLLSACSGSGSPPESSSDGPTYHSVASLSSQSNLVVRGTIGTLRGSEIDDGGNASGEGVPMSFFNVGVSEVMSGTLSGSSLVVAWVDQSEISASRSELTPGDSVVLFLEHLTSTDAPGIDTESDFYVPIAGDMAVFNVSGPTVTARSSEVTRLEDAGPGSRAAADTPTEDEPFTADLDEFGAVVEEYGT